MLLCTYGTSSFKAEYTLNHNKNLALPNATTTTKKKPLGQYHQEALLLWDLQTTSETSTLYKKFRI